MSKDVIKIISFVLALVVLLVGINHCQHYREEQEAAVTTAETTQQEKPQETQQHGYTVYVSRYDIIHKNPNCSGMIYYTEMGYYDAVAAGYTHCQNCY